MILFIINCWKKTKKTRKDRERVKYIHNYRTFDSYCSGKMEKRSRERNKCIRERNKLQFYQKYSIYYIRKKPEQI